MIKNVLFLCQGVVFAGAESYALNLIRNMASIDGVKCFVATCYDGPLKNRLENESFRVISLHGRNNIKSSRDVIKIVAAEKIDIIHCIDLKSTIVGGVASLFLKNVKTVGTVHGLPEPYRDLRKHLKYTFSLVVYFLFLRLLFDGTICVSNDLGNRMKRIIGSKRIRVIHNGIDLENSVGNTEQRTVDQNRKIKIGTVGRLDSVKGHIYLLEAARDIIKDRDDVIFQIIGTGPLENDLKEKAKKLGVADRVHFLGFRSDAKALIADMDIFVLPSLHEGIPYVLLEAMACSKPVICSGVGGINEVINNMEDGILVKPKDYLALCSKIKEGLANKELMSALGQKARCKVEKYYSSDSMAKNTFNYYGSI